MQPQVEDSSQRLQRDLLHLLLPDWSLRLALQVGLLLELVPPLQVLLARQVLPAAAAVAAPAASSSQAAAVAAAAGFVGA